MARRVVTTITLIDDLTGDEVPETEGSTVKYSFEGNEYEIDLTRHNIELFQKALEPYISNSRKVKSAPRAPRAPRGMPTVYKTIAARRWCKNHGFPNLPDRGRLPEEARQAYLDAHPSITKFD